MNIFLIIIIVFVSVIIGVYTGISYVSAIQHPPLEGLYKVSILRNLRNGKTGDAIEILESLLDTDIISYKLFFHKKKFLLNIFKGKDYGLVFAKEIAEYRKEFPSTAKNEVTRKEIMDFINGYEKIRLLRKPHKD